MVSLPTYDDNLFAKGISQADFQKLATDKNKPLIDNAVQSQFPPGSTFKLVTGTGGAPGPQDHRHHQDLGPAATSRSPATRFWDWNHAGFGMCDINCGFGHSSDTFFYQVATMLGADRLAYYAHMYGFGQPTGHRPAGRGRGHRPVQPVEDRAPSASRCSPARPRRPASARATTSSRPIQLINAYAALANGGKLYRPQLVETITGPDGNGDPAVQARPDPQAAGVAGRRCGRCASRPATTVTLRHTYNLVDMPVKVAGKSGTAEFGIKDKLGRLPYHSWFVGWVNKDPTSADFTQDRLAAGVPRLRLLLADDRQRGDRDREGLPAAATTTSSTTTCCRSS